MIEDSWKVYKTNVYGSVKDRLRQTFTDQIGDILKDRVKNIRN